MITKTDFEKAIKNYVDSEEPVTGTNDAAEACHELAKKMAIEFAKYAAGRFPTEELFNLYQNQK